MSYFRRPGPGLDQQPDAGTDELVGDDGDQPSLLPSASPRTPLTEHLRRIGRWFQGLDIEDEDGSTGEWDPIAELGPGRAARAPARAPIAYGEPDPDDPDDPGDPGDAGAAGDRGDPGDPADPAPRFPLARFGYTPAAVDAELAAMERRLAQRERELTELREQAKPPMSITEEIERLGEQTASILVVAHDQAHETTRRAQEQAERCIADAAANAVEITAEAKRRLRELDEETDSVWRERERLLQDTRAVSVHLATLVDDAQSRFPADADGERNTSDAPALG